MTSFFRSYAGVVSAAMLLAGVCRAQPAPFSEEQLLLDAAGLDADLLERFAAGKPATEDDRAAQLAALAGLRQIGQLDLDRLARPADASAELGDSAKGRLRYVRGIVKSIRPLELTDDEVTDLVAFLETLTSPQFAAQKAASLNPASCNVSTTKLAAMSMPIKTEGTAP